jgi:hypothetical protein
MNYRYVLFVINPLRAPGEIEQLIQQGIFVRLEVAMLIVYSISVKLFLAADG